MERYSQHFQQQARGSGKRQRTRAALLDTAIHVFAENGIHNTKISDITDTAGMANGTFYNHFKDRDELAMHTAVAVATEIAREVDEAMSDLDDGAQRVATGSVKFLAAATRSPEWGNLMVDAFHLLPAVRQDTVSYLEKDIRLGISQGKFDTEVDTFLIEEIVGLMITSLRRHIATGFDAEISKRTAGYVLRLLGLSPRQADALLEKMT